MRLPRARTLPALAAVAVFALLGTACAPSNTAGPQPTSTASSEGSTMDLATDIVGLWGTDAPGEPHLEFTADGQVHGSDGCNGIVTTYTVEDDRVNLAQFVSTLKACQGVDDWLRGVRAVELEDDVLIVSNAAGEQIGQLDRP